MKHLIWLVVICACASPIETATHEQAATVSTLHSFVNPYDPVAENPFWQGEGGHPRTGLLELNGRLYGTTWQNGPNMGGDETKSCSSNFYWGTAVQRDQCPGTVYSLALDGTDFVVEHAFSRIDPLLGRNDDGNHPVAALSLGPDGRLYGTTVAGGQPAYLDKKAFGVAYSFIPGDQGSFTVHHSFASAPRYADGAVPLGGIVFLPDGRGFGTAGGGNNGTGVAYQLDPVLGSVNLHTFALSVEGKLPYGSPTLGADGLLHGVTYYGGANNRGTVYSIDPDSGALTVDSSFDPYTFTGNTDNTPVSSPTLVSNDELYAAIEFGGSNGTGIIVQLSPGAETLFEFDAISLTTVPRFSNATGALPLGTLVEGADGLLYGTTFYGGEYGTGTVYRIARDGSLFQMIHSFGPGIAPGGNYPYSGLTVGSDGALYGTTFSGGTVGFGVVYRLIPPPLCP